MVAEMASALAGAPPLNINSSARSANGPVHFGDVQISGGGVAALLPTSSSGKLMVYGIIGVVMLFYIKRKWK